MANANDTALADSGIFGLNSSESEAALCLLGVPWEATTSYGDGASRGPEVILNASHQVDLFDIETGTQYQHGYYMPEISKAWQLASAAAKLQAQSVVAAISNGMEPDAQLLKSVNTKSSELNDWVKAKTSKWLSQNKMVGVVGGDHSTPFGLLAALTEKYKADFGILHIDAHADLRDAYQGFEFSHASIMHNVITHLNPKKLVQVGIRDYSPDENEFIKSHPEQIKTYFDLPLKRRLFRGETWQSLCNEIIEQLPQNVYISFDIDGLSPEFCPNTGTPVPGGLSFDQTLCLFATLHESGKKIIGFDLNEVAAPHDLAAAEWDGNVGARMLFKLCGWAMLSHNKK
jgi:agmatinase